MSVSAGVATGEPGWPRVDSDPISYVSDPDHDIPGAPRLTVPVEILRDHQRLVVNPLLAIFDGVVAIALIYHALRTRNLALFLAALSLLLLAFLLFQYHCLDCGSTGWYLHARHHACGPVVDRCARRGPRTRGLSVKTQRLIWVYILAAGVLGVAVMALARL